MQTYWRITYKQNNNIIDYGCFSKKEMVHEYLNILDNSFQDNISELKIWKNQMDYTATLNKFLMK